MTASRGHLIPARQTLLIPGIAVAALLVVGLSYRIPSRPLLGRHVWREEAMTPARTPSLVRLGWTFLKIGAFGFGGLAATLVLIEQELVGRLRAVDPETVTEALTYTKLLPGSTGVQVVSYLGWRLRGWPGALVGGAAFVTPAAASMLAIAVLYGRFARLPGVSLALHGMAAAIVGLLVVAVWRLARPNIVDVPAGVLAAAAFAVGYRLHLPPAWIVILAGLVGIGLELRRGGDAR